MVEDERLRAVEGLANATAQTVREVVVPTLTIVKALQDQAVRHEGLPTAVSSTDARVKVLEDARTVQDAQVRVLVRFARWSIPLAIILGAAAPNVGAWLWGRFFG